MRTVILLITSWGFGLAAYAGAMRGWFREVMSIDNWMLVGPITFAAWLLASVLVILPVLRLLARRPAIRSGAVSLAAAGAALAIVPVWFTVVLWYGWHPHHLLGLEAGLLAVLYGTSGLVLGFSLGLLEPRAAG